MSGLLRRAHSVLDYIQDPEALRARLRWPIFNWDTYRTCQRLRTQGLTFDVILDVGANVGVFALAAAHFFPAAMLQEFEPVPDCQRELGNNLRMIDPSRWHLWRCALGSKVGDIDLNVNEFSPSSSVLAMNEHHWHAFPGTRHSQPLRVQVATLDSLELELKLHGQALLKLDVQGYELEVLKGARHVLERVSHVLAETSFVSLYQGQPLHDAVHIFLEQAGFSFSGPYAVRHDPRTGQVLQMDALYTRGPGR